MKRKLGKFIFSRGLQKVVVLLRKWGLLNEKEFPELIGPIAIEEYVSKKRLLDGIPYSYVYPRFIAKIRIRKDFKPNEIWVEFTNRDRFIFISWDKKEWEKVSEDIIIVNYTG